MDDMAVLGIQVTKFHLAGAGTDADKLAIHQGKIINTICDMFIISLLIHEPIRRENESKNRACKGFCVNGLVGQ